MDDITTSIQQVRLISKFAKEIREKADLASSKFAESVFVWTPEVQFETNASIHQLASAVEALSSELDKAYQRIEELEISGS